MTEDEKIREEVRRYYGEILKQSDDLSTDACACASAAPPKYVLDALRNVDDRIIERFYGCGSPLPPALEGATVLDLGCGTGRDVYVASQLVGEQGHVIGIDMTPAQIEFAKSFEDAQMERFGYERSNVEFIEGFIEDMDMIADESIDVVISNCVVNLSPFKEQLFKEVFRVLKPGGELYFSDIFCDRRVPEGFYDDPILRGECLAGALYVEDFRRMLSGFGVKAFYDVAVEELHVGDFRLATKLGFATFYSHTVRAIKAMDLEDREENYCQTATYLGTLPENPRYFDLTDEVRLIKDRPVAISGNMALCLTESRYAPHFKVTPRKEHVGVYSYEQAQHALDLKRGKRTFGLRELERRCDDLEIEPFNERVHDPDLLKSAPLKTMQVNVGYACNLACSHCYLECSPRSTEMMDRRAMEACLAAFETGDFEIMDITGGSPEMNPHLAWFIEEASRIAKQVIVRSNLTILTKPEYAHFKEVYARNGVKIVTSLPYYDEQYCDLQRGKGVFNAVISMLRELNELGYGYDPRLQIDLVYNVDGPFLPPDQRELEEFYAYQLKKAQGVAFNGLYAFNNYPLGRFAQELEKQGKLDYYLSLLAENYNGSVVAHMMCRSQINVDYDGRVYDCEVNHVLGLPIPDVANIADLVDKPLAQRDIRTSPICYSCAAGSGSSCGGSLMEKVAFREQA